MMVDMKILCEISLAVINLPKKYIYLKCVSLNTKFGLIFVMFMSISIFLIFLLGYLDFGTVVGLVTSFCFS